ncbi:N-acetylglucosaminyldiphosphoundecaprenol N-acetyl-beta-D-mannosaminyltransferase [Zunongwangia mangrovi]|uniref:N-acetylglucosaminyldiphosphoundecaprenol N-acetyl-beta-D-mannosaminyltransferase n=1 Tax=Zunongwangia mangrovi TaxID=1334022 RepID=A0A1I1D9F8_9FLAO|nr:WecB/TagA/CpsF family glycosyltransferase [Zunongwangia mangrovi]SFB69718.1 N-acetylglucosaminyldiphosphoundecaprenol N-acetyl-beta-D-mannosaminyltransferase [Zunongwangia mangrovi]
MKKRLISIDISIKAYQDFIKDLTTLALNKKSTYTCVANVHMLVEAYKSKDFAEVVNNADMVTPDGMPLAKGLKQIYGIEQDRVAGMDLLPDLLKEAESNGIKVVFYGGTQLTLDKTKEFCDQYYPNLDIVGLISPPFRELSEEEEKDYTDLINKSGAGFVFVALGCPKQEKWMANMKGRINACMIGIGGALPVMVGLQNRAPVWMQKTSTEWLYRLSQEPKRLFKRYAYTNTLFVYLMLKEKLKR